MHVGIVGLGYVGLPLAVSFCEAGHHVVGVDVDPRKVEALGAAESYIEDVPSEQLEAVKDRLVATARFAELHPLRRGDHRGPDAADAQPRARSRAALLGAAGAIACSCSAASSWCSSPPRIPGTTRERLVPLLEESGLDAGSDFNVAFSPERVDPGRTDYTLRTTPKVVGGLTGACLERAAALYGEVCDEVVACLHARGRPSSRSCWRTSSAR